MLKNGMLENCTIKLKETYKYAIIFYLHYNIHLTTTNTNDYENHKYRIRIVNGGI